MDKKITTVEQYLSGQPATTRAILESVRNLIKKLCPDAVESIAYGMPAYKLNKKPLIYFAGYTNHIGIYATPSAHQKFSKALTGYKQGKGSVQFPLDRPLPMDLIKEIVIFKREEILQ